MLLRDNPEGNVPEAAEGVSGASGIDFDDLCI